MGEQGAERQYMMGCIGWLLHVLAVWFMRYCYGSSYIEKRHDETFEARREKI